MASPLYRPVGPIGSAESFLLIAIVEGIPLVATVQQNNNIIFLPISTDGQNISPLLNAGNILQLNITGTLNQAKLIAGNRQLLPVINSQPLTFALQDASSFSNPYLTLTTSYQDPPLPNILLSGAAYNFLGSPNDSSSRSVVLSIHYRDFTHSEVLTTTTRLYPIMINYIAFSGTTCSGPNTNILNTLRVFYCSWCHGSCPTFCMQMPIKTWTNTTDCGNDFNYVYCSNVGQELFCGQNGAKNCFARCENGSSCQLSVETQTLVCAGGRPITPIVPSNPLTPVVPASGPSPIPKPLKPVIPWYKTWWFILSAIVVLILVFALMYVFFFSRDEKFANQQQTSYPYVGIG